MMVTVFMHAFVPHDPFVNLTGGRSCEPAAAYLSVRRCSFPRHGARKAFTRCEAIRWAALNRQRVCWTSRTAMTSRSIRCSYQPFVRTRWQFAQGFCFRRVPPDIIPLAFHRYLL